MIFSVADLLGALEGVAHPLILASTPSDWPAHPLVMAAHPKKK